MAYSYKPLHWEGLGHAFVNIQMFLDYDREGVRLPDYSPSRSTATAARSSPTTAALPWATTPCRTPTSPTPKRCYEVGQTVARILKDSPYRVCMYASGGWSHGFLVEENDYLWPRH